MENEQDTVEEVEETLDLPEDSGEEGADDSTDWKAEARKLQEKAIAQRERTKLLKQQLKEAKEAVEAKQDSEKRSPSSETGGLDETQLDYLDLKGITEDEDIAMIESIVKKTGQTIRQVLKDEYVVTKLEANKEARDVKDATPSSTKRSGAGQKSDIALAIAKFEQTGELPEDFELAAAVTNAMVDKESVNKPAWH